MTRKFVIAAGVFCAMLIAATAWAVVMTITGQIVDPTCKPVTDLQCTIDGAKQGNQLELQGTDGKTYRLTGPYTDNKNAQLIEFLGKNVKATGNVTTGGSHRVMSVKALVEVKDGQ